MKRVPVRLDQKFAALSSEFGLDWATKLFGEEAIASLPVLKAGKNKGKPKGYVIWRKAATSGYCREISQPVRVGSLTDAWLADSSFAPRSCALRGQWLGRVQEIASSPYYLFQQGRDRHAADQAKIKADRDEEIAEWRREQAEKAS